MPREVIGRVTCPPPALTLWHHECGVCAVSVAEACQIVMTRLGGTVPPHVWWCMTDSEQQSEQRMPPTPKRSADQTFANDKECLRKSTVVLILRKTSRTVGV